MLQTPSNRRFGPRPSLGSQNINTASSPNLQRAHETAMARKASLNALTGATPRTPAASRTMGADGGDVEVGDAVDVPGDMYGVVKFVGTVKGKKGVFAGVELHRDFAGRGKNDGDVDGISYFRTSIPGSGIFLPLHRATKRSSPTVSSDSFPLTPTTPSLGNYHLQNNSNDYTPPTPSLKFSQSVGPGARAPSPAFKKPPRQSLPRPESPYRKQPSLAPTPGRGPSVGPANFSRSQIGAPRFNAPSPAPQKTPVTNKTRTPLPRPYSRTGSRLGQRIDEDDELTPVGMARTMNDARPALSRAQSEDREAEIQRLKAKLDERDKQLKEQAASLSEMETSLTELQNLIPEDGLPSAGDVDAAELRSIIREKNDKISMLTAEFDAHRADFRSTIDTLEMASTETTQIYEKRVEELMQEIRELQDRGEHFEGFAEQLKQLEELVQELEEGLEDARRGEAEARGEVEFLRGEVERGRSELRREREKAAEALKAAGASVDKGPLTPGGSTREVEARDDEIRGLKAIIHSLSSGPDFAQSPGVKSPLMSNGNSDELARLKADMERLEREKEELRGLVDRKSFREEELERELAALRGNNSNTNGATHAKHASIVSDRTLTQEKERRNSGRDSKGTIASWRSARPSNHSPHASRHDTPTRAVLEPTHEVSEHSVSGDSTNSLWCEICETGGHDILSCPTISSATSGAPRTPIDTSVTSPKPLEVQKTPSPKKERTERTERPSFSNSTQSRPSYGPPQTAPPTAALPIHPPRMDSLPNPYEEGLVKGKGQEEADPDKWCALCERDGHDATCCPFEDAF